MTFKEFLEELAKVDRVSEMELSPGPYILQVNETDGQAAKILMRLDEMIEDDTKLKEGEAILMYNAMRHMDADRILEDDGWYTEESRVFLYAWWWLVFWAAQKKD